MAISEFEELDVSGVSPIRLLELLGQGNDGVDLLQELETDAKVHIAETLWIFAQIVTMEFKNEN